MFNVKDRWREAHEPKKILRGADIAHFRKIAQVAVNAAIPQGFTMLASFKLQEDQHNVPARLGMMIGPLFNGDRKPNTFIDNQQIGAALLKLFPLHVYSGTDEEARDAMASMRFKRPESRTSHQQVQDFRNARDVFGQCEHLDSMMVKYIADNGLR